MQRVQGSNIRAIDAVEVAAWAASYRDVIVDLGTGDGRFVRDLARACPERAAIGVDTCQANLASFSRSAPGNALLLAGDALALPHDLCGLATRVTVNFPWGSLLRGLLDGHGGLFDGLRAVGRSGASLEIRLNAGALGEQGWALDAGGEQVAEVLERAGFAVGLIGVMGRDQLRGYPTTWAKRLAFGRDPRAIEVNAVFV